MTAEEVKDCLRSRHAAFADIGLGPWTTLEEFFNIDLLAFSAWSSKKPPIVGYEVKVSRGDYRRELLKPDKRAAAVELCWAFYFAVPKGLLTKEEKAYVQPEHFEDGSAFIREVCPSRPRCRKPAEHELTRGSRPGIDRRLTGNQIMIEIAHGDAACWLKDTWQGKRGDEYSPADEPQRAGRYVFIWEPCETCSGRGYMRKSVVEEEAPTLWIPPDVGLVEIDPGAANPVRTVRKAPVQEPTRDFDLCSLVRWASFRPDPRHAEAGSATLQVAA